MQKISILGSGKVGEALANGFLAEGHPVMRGSRDPQKLAAWKAAATGDAGAGTFDEAARWGDVVVLAIKGTAAEDLVGQLAPHLAGKPVIDATNPLADAPPQNGVIQLFTRQNESLMERLQARAPEARFVKAFNSIGNACMVHPKTESRPTMFICGNDDAAKQEVTALLTAFGWETSDLGKAEAARPIESLCVLWCIPGFLRNDWMHVYKVLPVG